MQRMQFRDFIFEHNPGVILLERQGRQAVFFCPGHGEVVQTLSQGRRQVRCTGDFVCPSASEAAALMAQFEQKCADGQPGILSLPGMDNMLAVLAEHSFTARGDGRTVPYTMRFIEAGGW